MVSPTSAVGDFPYLRTCTRGNPCICPLVVCRPGNTKGAITEPPRGPPRVRVAESVLLFVFGSIQQQGKGVTCSQLRRNSSSRKIYGRRAGNDKVLHGPRVTSNAVSRYCLRCGRSVAPSLGGAGTPPILSRASSTIDPPARAAINRLPGRNAYIQHECCLFFFLPLPHRPNPPNSLPTAPPPV